MKYLIDTNVLLRWAKVDSSGYSVCTSAVNSLTEAGHEVCICAQTLIEFYAVATRPVAVNGLGLPLSEVMASMADMREMFACLPEPPDMADRWQAVVERHSVAGKQAHDARIVALMQAHGVNHLITLNTGDFVRYKDATPLTPAEALARP